MLFNSRPRRRQLPLAAYLLLLLLHHHHHHLGHRRWRWWWARRAASGAAGSRAAPLSGPCAASGGRRGRWARAQGLRTAPASHRDTRGGTRAAAGPPRRTGITPRRPPSHRPSSRRRSPRAARGTVYTPHRRSRRAGGTGQAPNEVLLPSPSPNCPHSSTCFILLCGCKYIQ